MPFGNSGRVINTEKPQPRWGWRPLADLPRVAPSSQPWALGRNPFGIHTGNFRIPTGFHHSAQRCARRAVAKRRRELASYAGLSPQGGPTPTGLWHSLDSRANLNFRKALGLAACRNNRPVGAPGLQTPRIPKKSCRPGALTRRFWDLFNRLLGGCRPAPAPKDSILEFIFSK